MLVLRSLGPVQNLFKSWCVLGEAGQKLSKVNESKGVRHDLGNPEEQSGRVEDSISEAVGAFSVTTSICRILIDMAGRQWREPKKSERI